MKKYKNIVIKSINVRTSSGKSLSESIKDASELCLIENINVTLTHNGIKYKLTPQMVAAVKCY